MIDNTYKKKFYNTYLTKIRSGLKMFSPYKDFFLMKVLFLSDEFYNPVLPLKNFGERKNQIPKR